MKKKPDTAYILSLILLAAVFGLVVFLACAPNSKSRVLHNGEAAATETVAASRPAPKSSPLQPGQYPKALHIYFPDVGQGDCALLCSPNGNTMLIDAGEEDAAARVLALLEGQDVKKLDIVIASHMHSDHVGAMPAVLYAHEVGTFIIPASAKVEDSLSYALKDRNVPLVRADSEIKLDWDPETELKLLSPLPGISYSDENQGSIMMRVKYGETSILFTGDAGYQAEDLSLAAEDASLFQADVLKLGHHGSSDSTTPRFLQAVHPSFAVICCGRNNSYGHPHQSVLNQLSRRDIQVYRTDTDGTIHIILDGKNVYVEGER